MPTPSSATTSRARRSSALADRAASTVTRRARRAGPRWPAAPVALRYSSGSAEVRRSSGQSRSVTSAAKPAARRGRVGQLAQRRGQPGPLQHRRVQLGHRRAQQPRRLGQRLLDPVERVRVAGVPGVVEVVPGGQHVLQRAVVQVFGQQLALALLDAGELGEQLGAGLHQPADRRPPGTAGSGQPDAAPAPPRPRPGCAAAATPTAPRWPARVAMPGQQVRHDRRDHHGGADPGPQLGRGQHRDEQEAGGEHVGGPALRRGHAGEQGQRGQHGEVDEQGQPGQPDRGTVAARPDGDARAPTASVRPRRSAQQVTTSRAGGTVTTVSTTKHDQHRSAAAPAARTPAAGVLDGDGCSRDRRHRDPVHAPPAAGGGRHRRSRRTGHGASRRRRDLAHASHPRRRDPSLCGTGSACDGTRGCGSSWPTTTRSSATG